MTSDVQSFDPSGDVVTQARTLAEGLLAVENPRRWRHVQSVAAAAREFAVGVDAGDVAVAAAWLHDIGYAAALADTGFHPIDGARFLRRHGWPAHIQNLVAHHSYAVAEAVERGLLAELQEFDNELSALRDVLWAADGTTGPDGQRFTVAQRIEEIVERYGPDHLVSTCARRIEPEFADAYERTRDRLAASFTRRGHATQPTKQITDLRPQYESEWVTVSLADLELMSGETIDHHVVDMPAAAMVVLIDERTNAVLLTWRHRVVADVWNWELPGGLVEVGEQPAEAAARELLEETGYAAGDLQRAVTFEPMIGMLRSAHHLFISTEPNKIAEPIERDEGTFEWVPLAAVPTLIAEGLIHNSGTLVGLLHVLALRSAGLPA